MTEQKVKGGTAILVNARVAFHGMVTPDLETREDTSIKIRHEDFSFSLISCYIHPDSNSADIDGYVTPLLGLGGPIFLAGDLQFYQGKSFETQWENSETEELIRRKIRVRRKGTNTGNPTKKGRQIVSPK